MGPGENKGCSSTRNRNARKFIGGPNTTYLTAAETCNSIAKLDTRKDLLFSARGSQNVRQSAPKPLESGIARYLSRPKTVHPVATVTLGNKVKVVDEFHWWTDNALQRSEPEIDMI